jgi:hypothetical protein
MPTPSPWCIHADIPAIVFEVPAGPDLLTVPPPAPPLADPTSAIAQALLTPHGILPLAQMVASASLEKAPTHKIAVIANSSDGIGAPAYVHELALLQSLPDPRDYVSASFQCPVVQKDQWEVEMWCRGLEHVGGPAGLLYCTIGICPGDLEKLPLTSGYISIQVRAVSTLWCSVPSSVP